MLHRVICSTLLVFSLSRTGQAAPPDQEVFNRVVSGVPSSDTVTYNITMANLWNAVDHPICFPSPNEHWSWPMIAAHVIGYGMWTEGTGKATQGIVNIAETGSTTAMETQLDDARIGGDVRAGFQRGGLLFMNAANRANRAVATSTSVTLEVDSGFPLVSSASMMAPSPDWFSGFENVTLIDATTGNWYRKIEVYTYTWDAGDDSGVAFNSGNANQSPRDDIASLVEGSILASCYGSDSDPCPADLDALCDDVSQSPRATCRTCNTGETQAAKPVLHWILELDNADPPSITIQGVPQGAQVDISGQSYSNGATIVTEETSFMCVANVGGFSGDATPVAVDQTANTLDVSGLFVKLSITGVPNGLSGARIILRDTPQFIDFAAGTTQPFPKGKRLRYRTAANGRIGRNKSINNPSDNQFIDVSSGHFATWTITVGPGKCFRFDGQNEQASHAPKDILPGTHQYLLPWRRSFRYFTKTHASGSCNGGDSRRLNRGWKNEGRCPSADNREVCSTVV